MFVTGKPVTGKDFIDRLKHIIKVTNKKRDLDVFYDSIKDETEIDDFKLYIQDKIKKETTLVTKLLENSTFTNTINQNSLKKIEVKKILKTKIAFIRDRLITLSSKTTTKELHSLRIEFKRVRYLLESFKELHSTKKIQIFIKKSKWYQNRLGELNDFAIQKEIIKEYLKEVENKILVKKLKDMKREIKKLKRRTVAKNYF